MARSFISFESLNASSNSFSLNTVSFKVEFTVGRYDLKIACIPESC